MIRAIFRKLTKTGANGQSTKGGIKPLLACEINVQSGRFNVFYFNSSSTPLIAPNSPPPNRLNV